MKDHKYTHGIPLDHMCNVIHSTKTLNTRARVQIKNYHNNKISDIITHVYVLKVISIRITNGPIAQINKVNYSMN